MDDLQTGLVDVARAIPGVVSVYLFGSMAEGRAHAESDVDLGVLLDRALHPADLTPIEQFANVVASIERATRADRQPRRSSLRSRKPLSS